MRSPRSPLLPLVVLLLGTSLPLLGPAALHAQEPPLAAGSDGVPIPKKTKHVQPTYPEEALEEGLRGIVILDLVIDPEGNVAEMHVIRSIPGLDEAALAAARQWRYEPVEVDGRPVSVRLTVPITFALRLPEISRDRGIPEIRQGVTPAWPENIGGGGSAAASVTLDPDGRVGLARIIEGGEPWSGSLLRALRTWRFRAPPEDVTVSFRVEAEFVPRGDRGAGEVKLHLSGLQETALFDAPGEPADVAVLEPAGRPGEPFGMPPEPSPEETAPAGPGTAEREPQAPAPVAESEPPAPGIAGPGPEEAAGTEPPAPVAGPEPEPPVPGTAGGGPEAPAATPEPPAAAPGPEETAPAEPPSSEIPPATAEPGDVDTASPVTAAGPAPAPETVAVVDPTAPPPIEVLRAAPPPPPPENGVSAIRGVVLEPGVPDLTRGRRPISPPFARMAGASGVVAVDFSVSAGGIPTVQSVDGPEILTPAATQAVESWVFRRTRADRAYLTAVFTYEDDLASAVVKPQPPP